MHGLTDEDAQLVQVQQPRFHAIGRGLRTTFSVGDGDTLDSDITALMVQLSWVPDRAQEKSPASGKLTTGGDFAQIA